MIEIVEDDLSGEATLSLLEYHLRGMHRNSPPGNVFALDISGLQSPAITVWTAWQGKDVVGFGALKRLDGGTGELKSMRTHPDWLRTGVAAALLEHIIVQARAEGLTQISLETGSGPAFEPALALYRKRGFMNGAPFADYIASPFNQFLHLVL